MRTFSLASPFILALALAAAGCAPAGTTDSGGTGTHGAVASPESGVSLRLGQAEKLLATGTDSAKARGLFEAVKADPAATKGEVDTARLGAARAAEATGDHEAAIRAVEDLLADRGRDGDFKDEGAATRLLSELVAGSEPTSSRRPDEKSAVPPLARVLTRYFPPRGDGLVDVSLFVFGGDSDTSARLGTWNVAGAVRSIARDACVLCDDTSNVHVNVSRFRTWLQLPEARSALPKSLVVFYVDLEENFVPPRYDAYLPIPSAEIKERLTRGESFVVAKEREGAPPVILLAAPRAAELDDLEADLAARSQLPTSVTVVPIDRALRRSEIQRVVSAQKGAFRACYDDRLARAPKANEDVMLSLTIEDGAVKDHAVTSTSHDPAFEACLSSVVASLVFPKTGQNGHMTVRYPVLFRPAR